MTITFAAAINAVTLDLSTIFRSSGNIVLSFSNGDSVQASLGNPFAFHGYTTNTSFTSMTIGAFSGDYLLIDNLRFGNVDSGNVVPEPSSLLLAGVGFLAFRRRR